MQAMKSRYLILIIFCLYVQEGNAHSPDSLFSMELINHSSKKVYFRFNDFVDSLQGGQTLVFHKQVEAEHALPAYFFVYLNTAPPENKMFRILFFNVSGRKIIITKNDEVSFISNVSESSIEKFYSGLNGDPSPEQAKNYILANKDDPSSAEVLSLEYCSDKWSAGHIKALYDVLPERIKQSPSGKNVASYLEGRIRFVEGAIVRDFALNDSSDKIKTLYDIDSGYILMDFWFSRCIPCINTFPELKRLYAMTDRRHLEIVGISVDQHNDLDKWKLAIRDNQLPWINLIDPDYSVSYRTFSIIVYPTTILISNHKIVKINPTHEEILDLVNGQDHVHDAK
jgi:thiol-disulfide isomerase/thioredoxin